MFIHSFVEVSNFIPNVLDMYKYFDIIIISINVFILLKGLIDFDNKIGFMQMFSNLNSF